MLQNEGTQTRVRRGQGPWCCRMPEGNRVTAPRPLDLLSGRGTPESPSGSLPTDFRPGGLSEESERHVCEAGFGSLEGRSPGMTLRDD